MLSAMMETRKEERLEHWNMKWKLGSKRGLQGFGFPRIRGASGGAHNADAG